MKQRIGMIILVACMPMAPSLAGAQEGTAGVGGPPAPPQADEGKVFTLAVEPARLPHAALQYPLLPPLLDQTPGNAAILYGRASLLAAQDDEEPEQRSDDIRRWLDQPLNALPLTEVREALAAHGSELRELSLAARREYCHWDLPIRSEHVSLLLPELSRFRQLARILALRTRLAIAERRYDDAIHDLQTGFALARHLGEAPLLIHSLVGMAIGSMMTDCLQDLVQAPGAPNLYWAIAFLPRPLVSIRPALETEMNLIFLLAPQLQTVETVTRTPEEWSAFGGELAAVFQAVLGALGPSSMASDQARVMVTLTALQVYPRAKQMMENEGYSAADVEAMPVPQVVALHLVRTLTRMRDDVFKWFGVPFPQAFPRMVANAEFLIFSADADTVIPALMRALIPAVSRVYLQQTDLERKRAVLQCVEALRLHAAEQGGGLPGDLEEIEVVPIPEDPVTGAPFIYQNDGAEASLFCPAPAGEGKQRFERTYVVTLRND